LKTAFNIDKKIMADVRKCAEKDFIFKKVGHNVSFNISGVF
jgi:hypothetical protein